ncbi:SH3 domain-containing protein [Terrisporobacter sp.]
MNHDIFKKVLVTGFSTAICVGTMSMTGLPNYNNATITNVFADTLKDSNYSATGIITSNVSLRKGPSTSYPRLSTLKKGTKVTIVAKSSNGWYKIKFKGNFNYVYNSYVKITKHNDKNDKDKKDDIAFNITGVANSNVNVRKGANTSFNKIGTLKKNTKVTIVAKSFDSSWYKIKFKNGYGYVSSQYINISKNNDNTQNQKDNVTYPTTGIVNHAVDVRKGDATSFDKIGVLNKNEKVKILSKTTYGWYKIQYKTGIGYVYSSYINIAKDNDKSDKDKKDDIAFNANGVANSNVNVRKGANTSFNKIGLLKKNTKVTIVAKSSNGWYKIKFNNSYGYVSSQYINTYKDNNKTLKNDDVIYPTIGVVNHDVDVKKGNATSFDKIGVLNKDDKVKVLAKTAYGWYVVQYKTETGYVYSQYIDINSN